METPTSIRAEVRYVNAEWKGRKEIPRIGSKETRRANTSRKSIDIYDARPGLANGEITLDGSGFTLAKLVHAVEDFRDIETTARQYYPAVEKLVADLSGAKKVFVRDHLVRTEVPIDFNDGYARFVHCDYNMKRLREMSESLLETRGIEPSKDWTYAWFNTWQPFDNPAVNNPLAFIDWQSLPEDDVIDYFYTGRNRESLVAAPVYNPDHVWRYVPSMSPDEILIFKQMDGRRNASVYCPRTSFDNPAAPDDAPPRRSVETRLLAVFQRD